MCFFDVRETYFNAYWNVMNPVYKDPHEKICVYTEMKKLQYTTLHTIPVKISNIYVRKPGNS